MKLSLRNRVLFPVLALIIFGMGLLAAISYYKSKIALQEAIIAQIIPQADSAVRGGAAWVRDRTLDIDNWHRQAVYMLAVTDSPEGLAARKTAMAELRRVKNGSKYYENICVANAAGDIVAAADSSAAGAMNLSAQPFFKAALAGKSFVSDIMKSKATGNPVFVVSEPVAAPDNHIGVFFGVVDLNSFNRQFIDTIKIGQTGYAYMYRKDGTLIAHPDKSQILKLNMTAFDFGREMMAKGNGLTIYTWKGVEKIVAYRTYDKMGWTVGIGAASSDVFGPVKSLGGVNLTVALIVIVLACIIILLIVNSILKPINRIVEEITQSSGQVSSGSRLVSSSSQGLADGASEQASAIEETSSSMEEISSLTRQNADRANQADNLMKDANQVFSNAEKSMVGLTRSMNEISAASEETSKIVKTIDEIAFQTNLLALNAAVEAARAGEAGAGFAVVADEVRNLAMRAATAARNTATLIEETVGKVQAGEKLVVSTNAEFTEAALSAKQVGDLLAGITSASNEQTIGIDQVNAGITQLDNVVQQNAAKAEESASVAEQMNAQAVQMNEIVDELSMLVGRHSVKTAREFIGQDNTESADRSFPLLPA